MKKKSMVNLNSTQRISLDVTKLFPLEVYIGGRDGSLGVSNLQDLNSHRQEGVYTFFFNSQDTQVNWLKHIEKVTGSYRIHDFYQFIKKKEQ